MGRMRFGRFAWRMANYGGYGLLLLLLGHLADSASCWRKLINT